MYESYATPKQVRRTKSKNYSSHQWYTFSLGKWRKNQKKWAKQGKSQMNQQCKLNWLLKMLHALSLLSVKSFKIQVIQSFITTLLDLIWKVIVFHLVTHVADFENDNHIQLFNSRCFILCNEAY